MNRLEKLSNQAYYTMHDFSQLTINLIEKVEEEHNQAISHKKDTFLNFERLGAIWYRIGNILEVIDPKRSEDKRALGFTGQIKRKLVIFTYNFMLNFFSSW